MSLCVFCTGLILIQSGQQISARSIPSFSHFLSHG